MNSKGKKVIGKSVLFFITLFSFTALSACTGSTENNAEPIKQTSDTLQHAYFAAGCFWCVEAIFESIEGVYEVTSGYAGGKEKNPTYDQVSSGKTGHAETVKIDYNPKVVSYETLLEAFFGSHDPTTLNQQGPDFGTQYRSIIFYQNQAESVAAEKMIQKLLDQKVFDKITTEVIPLEKFYPAEIYHQDYEKNHPDNPYVQKVSRPRIDAFKRKFKHILKKDE